MIKISSPNAWNFNEQTSVRVKVSRRGLQGSDLQEFVKRASHDFVQTLMHTKLAAGEEPMHQLIVGATEAYGPNRNGDGFRDAVCAKFAHTFEKFARFYRNHDNRDPRKSYGRIIKAAYHPTMQRIELLIGLNGTKQAAEQNHGLVADKEMEKLARGDDIPGSMACRVAEDICSGCGKHSATPDDYCTASTCEYGGLRHNIMKVAEDGHILHADNPEPYFFDCSAVFRPADRIAYSLGSLMQKAAGAPASGAALAIQLGMVTPENLLLSANTSTAAAELIKTAYAVAELESALPAVGSLAFAASVQPPVDDFPAIDTPTELKQFLTANAREKIALPLRDFLAFGLRSKQAAASVLSSVQERLPGVFNRLIKSSNFEQLVATNPYAADALNVPIIYQSWAAKHANAYAVSLQAVIRRTRLAALRGEQLSHVKSGEYTPNDYHGAEQLAKHYALYRLSTLHACRDNDDFRKTSTFLIRQNNVV